MKKIIGLYASANKGKTATLNKLIDLLGIVADNCELNRFSNDSSAYFEVLDKKVVICTGGDFPQTIQNNITFAKNHNYDIFVTATRTKGGTAAELIDFTNQENAEIVWFQKEDDETKNKLIASELFSLIVKDIAPDFEKSIWNH